MAQTLKQFKKEQYRLSKKRIEDENFPKKLTIVAEGDSWFDYPLKKDIIDYLIKKGYAVVKFAKAGDTLENMILGTEYIKNRDTVRHLGPKSMQNTLNSIRRNKPNFVMFSGGGNDIVGSEILGYLNHGLSNPEELINKSIFQSRLKQIEIVLEYFVQAVHATHEEAQILMDGYDYAKVNGKGYSFVFKNIKGPWLLPSFAMKAITLKSDQEDIIRYLVDEFNLLLKRLDDKFDYFHHIDLRGQFPEDSQWDNEIHLKNRGYKKVAGIYHNTIVDILGEDPIERLA